MIHKFNLKKLLICLLIIISLSLSCSFPNASANPILLGVGAYEIIVALLVACGVTATSAVAYNSLADDVWDKSSQSLKDKLILAAATAAFTVDKHLAQIPSVAVAEFKDIVLGMGLVTGVNTVAIGGSTIGDIRVLSADTVAQVQPKNESQVMGYIFKKPVMLASYKFVYKIFFEKCIHGACPSISRYKLDGTLDATYGSPCEQMKNSILLAGTTHSTAFFYLNAKNVLSLSLSPTYADGKFYNPPDLVTYSLGLYFFENIAFFSNVSTAAVSAPITFGLEQFDTIDITSGLTIGVQPFIDEYVGLTAVDVIDAGTAALTGIPQSLTDCISLIGAILGDESLPKDDAWNKTKGALTDVGGYLGHLKDNWGYFDELTKTRTKTYTDALKKILEKIRAGELTESDAAAIAEALDEVGEMQKEGTMAGWLDSFWSKFVGALKMLFVPTTMAIFYNDFQNQFNGKFPIMESLSGFFNALLEAFISGGTSPPKFTVTLYGQTYDVVDFGYLHCHILIVRSITGIFILYHFLTRTIKSILRYL